MGLLLAPLLWGPGKMVDNRRRYHLLRRDQAVWALGQLYEPLHSPPTLSRFPGRPGPSPSPLRVNLAEVGQIRGTKGRVAGTAPRGRGRSLV